MVVQSIPPVVGEYAYYDSRMSKQIQNGLTINNSYPHWLIKTSESNDSVGCHYSIPQKLPYQPFITCHGIISEVGKCIN